jgi:hypothetical protein
MGFSPCAVNCRCETLGGSCLLALNRRSAGKIKLCAAVICVFSAAFTISSSADDSTASVHVRSNYPVVSFDVALPGPDGQLNMPLGTPHFTSFLDEHDVYAIRIGDGVARNIATISAQGSGIDFVDLDLDGLLKREQSLTRLEKAALIWLQENQVKIEGDAIVWHYTFGHTFNNIVIKRGWPSAFAQADAIKAFILAYRKSSDRSYLDLALHAGLALTVPCERGGVRCEVGGVPWFEEIPVPYGYAPMILNGHLYSTVMLYHLYKLTGDERIAHALEEGVASAKRMLLRFDTGYWSIYQVRPRALYVMLVLEAIASNTVIQEVSLTSAVSEPSVLRLGRGETSTFAGNQTSGEGWRDISDWGRKLTGMGMIRLMPGRMTIDHDPVDISEMNVTVHYRSSGCVVPTLATQDYRASSSGFVQILPRDSEATEEECIAHFSLPNTINQWSQINGLYHEWHTKLVTELWRITKDPKFYATSVRWRRYAAAEQQLKGQKTEGTISMPIFIASERADEDADIMQAMGGADPMTVSDDEVAEKLRHWLTTNCVEPQRAAELVSRAGLSPDKVKASAC